MFNDKKKRAKSERMDSVMEKPRRIIGEMKSDISDPNGSYTGVPENARERPVQDADDL